MRRILVVGAGALGGYFGGRLLAAGADVTFLLRPRRAAQLAATGLAIRSPFGDLDLPAPPSVLAEDIREPFDLVVVGCKAYDLAQTMESFSKAVGPDTAILPLLNGMRHLEALKARFGDERVLGGLCMISAALDDEGVVRHLNDMHVLVYGELDGSRTPRIEAIEAAFAQAGFDARASREILQDMWEKWVFIASAAGMTCLMRASVGDIEQAGGSALAMRMVDECAAIAAQNGFAMRPDVVERARAMLTRPGSTMTASMFKDIERGAPVEADHIVGDLLSRRMPAGHGAEALSLLQVAHVHLKTYEARRARESMPAASDAPPPGIPGPASSAPDPEAAGADGARRRPGVLSRNGVDRLRSLLLPLLAGLGAALLLIGFAALAGEILEGDTRGFDLRLLEAVRQMHEGHRRFLEVMRDLSGLGSFVVLGFVTVATAIYLLMLSAPRSALLVAVSASSGALLVALLKPAFGRPRPLPEAADYIAWGMSFPSGHATMSAVVFLTIGALMAYTRGRWSERLYILAVAFVAAFLVGASRVVLGVHWTTDVLAGWALGAAWAMGWLLVAHGFIRAEWSSPAH